jgi:hypothetical protein
MLQQVRTHDYTLGWTPDDGSAPPPIPLSHKNSGDKTNFVNNWDTSFIVLVKPNWLISAYTLSIAERELDQTRKD